MKIGFISLGCDKNLVDTEMMLGSLAAAGFEPVNDESDAEIMVVNTCSFIRDAKEESINTLIRLGELKKQGRLKALIAAGCLAERYTDEIRESLPEVDAVVGTMAIDEIAVAVDRVFKGERPDIKKSIDGPLIYGKKRILTTGGHFAYLKIAEGCDKHCTYCAIPSFRGKFRSVPMEVLVDEARELAAGGVKELILVAQETTLYGMDLYGQKKLPELLRKLSEIEDLYFIRVLYCYPEEIDDALIAEIRDNSKVCHYIDMPIQHASDSVLKRMGRRTTEADLRAVVSKLRKEIPDIAIRTTLITGFPGETRKDFKILENFVAEMKFDRLGVFTYSKEEGTGASRMKGQVPGFLKKLRRSRIMKLQQAFAFAKALEEKGRKVLAMVEGKMPDESAQGKNVYVCRTYKDAPDVDGFMFVETGHELMTGDVIKCVVTGADNYDLIGEIENEFTE